MIASIEYRLWLATHLLYPNSSQAFEVYQALVLQCNIALEKDDRNFIFSELVSAFDNISAISSNLSFYEFEFESIEKWKLIYKSSQKNQLTIFVGVLIFELKINEIAPLVKLTQEKTQFLFHQMFKKFSQSAVPAKFNEQLSFKKHNDFKVSYLFTYENLIEYCLGQLSNEDCKKVEKGLQYYPTLTTTKNEYQKIINQIQTLKVQRAHSFSSNKNPIRNSTEKSSEAYYKNKKVITNALFGLLGIIFVIFQSREINKLFIRTEKTVVLQKFEKIPNEPTAAQPSIALESLPMPTELTESAAASYDIAVVKMGAVSEKRTALSEKRTALPSTSGGLYRGVLIVKDLTDANKKVHSKVMALGAKKAGEVELGWLKSRATAYYHFTLPEENIEIVYKFFKQLGHFHIKFEPHPRLMPQGVKRFIIEVKN